MKQTDIFDRLNNTIGNHMEGKATDQDLIRMAYEVDRYLLQHPHPHDLIKNNVGLSDVVGQSEQFYCELSNDNECMSTGVQCPECKEFEAKWKQ